MSNGNDKTNKITDTTADETKIVKVIYGRIGKGEDVIPELKKIAKELRIRGGSIVLLGALSEAKLGYYDMEKKKYEELPLKFDGLLEMTGNGFIAEYDGEPVIHIHVSLGDECSSYTGHMMEEGNKVGAVVEYTIFVFEDEVIKVDDSESGLKIIEGSKFDADEK